MEKVEIYDLSGNRVHDPEGAIDYASGISWSTAAPKGFMEASFKVKRSDVFADWVVRDSYTVLIYDDSTLVYDGRIDTKPNDLQGTDEYITVNCTGWWAVLEERDIHKWWIDPRGISRLRWPDNLETDPIQTSWVNTKRDNILQVFAGTGDLHRNPGDMYRELYELPAGTVRTVSFDYVGRTGERLDLNVYSVDGGITELTVIITGGAVQDGTVTDFPFVSSTGSFEYRIQSKVSDLFDQNDYIHPSNLRVEANYETGHTAFASPLYTQGEIVQDVILLVNQKGAQISTDFSQLDEPGFILDPFTVEEPTYAGQVIEKIAGYGDAGLNTWIPAVWDRSDTSDGKPRFTFEAMSIADWEYEVFLNARELASLNYEKASAGLFNNVTVQFVNNRNEIRYRRYTDNAALRDATSVASEYQRDYFIKLGAGDTTRADYIGQRFIRYHKDRLTRGSISIKAWVTLKGGGAQVPASWVRAGKRIKILNTGEIFYIRYTSYDAETKTVRISPDLPQDNIAMLFTQRERNFGELVR